MKKQIHLLQVSPKNISHDPDQQLGTPNSDSKNLNKSGTNDTVKNSIHRAKYPPCGDSLADGVLDKREDSAPDQRS